MPLFVALAMQSARHVGSFNAQELANAAWAFATAGEPMPALLDPVTVLDAQEMQGVRPDVIHYDVSIHSLAVTNKISPFPNSAQHQHEITTEKG